MHAARKWRHGDASVVLFDMHGLSNTPEYHCWEHMLQRCNTPSDPAFKHYGARGITVCKRWRRFSNFFADMGKRPSAAHSLDRIDNDGNYEPGNCRWAIQSEQMVNQRMKSTNKSGFRGVSYSDERKKWVAQIAFMGQYYSIGRFDSKEEAAWMYDQWAMVIHGDLAHLNFQYSQ